MAKDKKARAQNDMTVTALANVVAALIDTMQNTGLPPRLVLGFLDELERMNALTIQGRAADFLSFLVDVLRSTVPSND